MKIKLLLLLTLLTSCSERIKVPLDSEVRSIRSEPPHSLYATLDNEGKFLLEGSVVKPAKVSEVFKSCYQRAGSNFIIILKINKNRELKDLHKIFKLAAKAKLKNFYIVVEDKNEFRNYRHFQIMSEVDYKKHSVEQGEIFYTDSSKTIQEIISSISSKKEKLPDFTYYSYYVVY